MKEQIDFQIPLLVSTEVTISVTLPLFLATWNDDKVMENRTRHDFFGITMNDPNSIWGKFRIVELKQYGSNWKIYESTADEKSVAELLGKKHTGDLIEITRTEFFVLFNEAMNSYASILNLL
jgi:hypothetical protein